MHRPAWVLLTQDRLPEGERGVQSGWRTPREPIPHHSSAILVLDHGQKRSGWLSIFTRQPQGEPIVVRLPQFIGSRRLPPIEQIKGHAARLRLPHAPESRALGRSGG